MALLLSLLVPTCPPLCGGLVGKMAVLHCDVPYPWQIGFQDGATPTFEGIVELHDTIFFYLVVISFLVF
jgi:hypothetical protein